MFIDLQGLSVDWDQRTANIPTSLRDAGSASLLRLERISITISPRETLDDTTVEIRYLMDHFKMVQAHHWILDVKINLKSLCIGDAWKVILALL